MGPSQPLSGSVQPPRMFGMPPPPLPNQSMTAIPALSQTGAPVSGTSKIDPNQIPRPIPSSSSILYETRQGNQANPPPVFPISSIFFTLVITNLILIIIFYIYLYCLVTIY